MYQKVSTDLNFVDREKNVGEFWRNQKIFEKSMKAREGNPTYTFYDGPPTANGKPHIGHVLTRVIKDMIPRYKTMKGYMVPRKAGWDTHGLPVELEVEKLLGIEKADDGAEIDYYISMDISGINKLNELVGGVTVTIPNDDLLALDPTLKGGETIKLTGMQAEYFTRTRYDTAEPTNEARMARQRIYLNSLETLLEEKIRANVNYVNTLLNEMGMIFDRTTTLDSGFGFTTDDATGTAITDTTDHYLMANVSIDNLALLANRVMDYEVLDVETLNGVHSLGSDEHIHFDLYENEALNWTLKTFYTEAAGN